MRPATVTGTWGPQFDPGRCDLCGASETTTVLDVADRSLTSDLRLVERGMKKVRCTECGLVRSGDVIDPDELQRHYEEDYALWARAKSAEPIFFTDSGPRPRSDVFFSWIQDSLAQAGVESIAKVLEVGAGEGSLLARFAAHPGADIVHGLDLNPGATREAAKRGLVATTGSYRQVADCYDLIYAVAVLEHVPSPRDFIGHLGAHLTDRGVLVVCQPCQDRESNDIFLRDHLWHFSADHVTALAASWGLVERYREVGTDLVPDFSIHVFARTLDSPARAPVAIIGADRVEESIRRWRAVFAGVDTWLRAVGVPIAVWGLGHTFSLVCAYSALNSDDILIGVDDNPRRHDSAGFPFPVTVPEQLAAHPDRPPVLVTFRPGNGVLARLRASRLKYHYAVPTDQSRSPGGAV